MLEKLKTEFDTLNIDHSFIPIVAAYIEAALWVETVETGNHEHQHYDKSFSAAGYTIEDLGHGELKAAIRDCLAFYCAAGDLLEGLDPEHIGHDFWLTRCGHGAGFWDRGLGDAGDILTALVGHGTLFPNLDLCVGDDGKVYGFT